MPGPATPSSPIRSPELYDTDRTSTVIAVNDVHKRHGNTIALRGLTFSVTRGAICALLGPNGSGKTTAIKLLLGLSRADAGTMHVFGLRADHEASSIAIRRRTAFVSETKELLPHLSVGETIGTVRRYFPTWRHDLERDMLSQFALPREQRVAALSKGMRAKLSLLLACCREAELLILDEPTDGLDPASADQVLTTLVRMVADSGVTVLISSHQLHEVERIAESVAFVREGSCVLQEDLDALRASVRRLDVHWPVASDATVTRMLEEFGQTVQVLESRVTNEHVSLLVRGDWRFAAQHVSERSATDVRERAVDLRELFLALTGSAR